jgi:hypothetical protein
MKTFLAIPFLALTLSLTACGAAPDEELEMFEDAADGKEDSLRTGRFEIITGKDGQFYFHLLAGNGEKVLSSEGYTTKQSAEDAVATVQFNGAHADSYQLLEAKNGQWYFNLLAGNWEVIASSELYASRANAERARDTVVSLITRAKKAAAPRTARFFVFRGLDGKYYFNLRAGNGQIVLQSQAYTRRASAVAGTQSVRENGLQAGRYEVREASNGQHYFVLKAANGQVIGASELYAGKSNAERGAETVRELLGVETIQAAK